MDTFAADMAKHEHPYCGCMFFTANALGRVLMKMADETFQPLGLTPTQAFILMSIGREPGITMSRIAKELRLDISTITRTLDKMKLGGLLYTEPYKKTVRLFALPDGHEKVADVKAAWKKLAIRYSHKLGKAHTAKLADEMNFAYDALTMFENA